MTVELKLNQNKCEILMKSQSDELSERVEGVKTARKVKYLSLMISPDK